MEKPGYGSVLIFYAVSGSVLAYKTVSGSIPRPIRIRNTAKDYRFSFSAKTDQLFFVEALLATVHIVAESPQPVVQHLHVAVQDRALHTEHRNRRSIEYSTMKYDITSVQQPFSHCNVE